MSAPRPSLNALRAFEATARLRSMSAAAQELAVTHGAVSRHVRGLEEMFGLPLLLRDGQGLKPSANGARLVENLSAAFNLIDASVAQLRPGPLTLSCSATVMMHWVLPRISTFHARRPGVDVHFNINYEQVDFVREEISVAIRNTRITPPRSVVIRELMVEWIGPVCSPAYAQSLDVKAVPDLSSGRLLSTKTRPRAWRDWLDASGAETTQVIEQEQFEHFYLLIQAALCGLGFALVPRMLVMNELASGRLVAPLGFVPGPHRLVLWIAPHLRAHADTMALAAWLEDEMRQTETAS